MTARWTPTALAALGFACELPIGMTPGPKGYPEFAPTERVDASTESEPAPPAPPQPRPLDPQAIPHLAGTYTLQPPACVAMTLPSPTPRVPCAVRTYHGNG